MEEQILRWFASAANPVADGVFTALTVLGEQEVAVALVAWVLWNVSTRRGLVLALTVLGSAGLNQALKLAFAAPRPFQVLAGFEGHRLETAGGYSFPSGHTQGAATLAAALGFWARRPWVWALGGTLAVGVAVSRVYLGVHWPHDVAAGLVLGVAAAWALGSLVEASWDEPKKRTLVVGAFGALGLGTAAWLALGLGGPWAQVEDLAKVGALAAGAAGGFVVQDRWVPYGVGGGWGRKVLRWALGVGLALGLLAGLKAWWGPGPGADALRYLAAGVWVTLGVPALGRAVGLFSGPAAPDSWG